MNQASVEFGFEWFDPDAEWKRTLAEELVKIASAHRMKLALCSQPEYPFGAVERGASTLSPGGCCRQVGGR